MAIDQDKRRYFDVGDDPERTYAEKLDEYRRLADEYFQVEAYGDFCDASLPFMRELAVSYFGGPEFDELLVDIVRSVFPAHEVEQMVERHRGFVGAWLRDQQAA
jgi:hypothetical protein